jgi:putative phosphoesterase
MRIGVVSDTHNHMDNVGRIVELFNAARVERVVHTGDITQAKTLHVLARLEAPLVGVYGNNDLERESLEAAASEHGLDLVDPPLHFVWAERRIVVVHDPKDLDRDSLGAADVALHGHEHREVIEHREGSLVFNPGECAGHMPGLNQIGVLDLVRLETEILRF